MFVRRARHGSSSLCGRRSRYACGIETLCQTVCRCVCPCESACVCARLCVSVCLRVSLCLCIRVSVCLFVRASVLPRRAGDGSRQRAQSRLPAPDSLCVFVGVRECSCAPAFVCASVPLCVCVSEMCVSVYLHVCVPGRPFSVAREPAPGCLRPQASLSPTVCVRPCVRFRVSLCVWRFQCVPACVCILCLCVYLWACVFVRLCVPGSVLLRRGTRGVRRACFLVCARACISAGPRGFVCACVCACSCFCVSLCVSVCLCAFVCLCVCTLRGSAPVCTRRPDSLC